MSFYRSLSLKTVIRFMNYWPPYFGAGVKINLLDEKEMIIKVSMPLKKLNKNYVGTHFGGSLYSMVDPFYMLILMQKLGRDYIVWDKEAHIYFKKPGKDCVHCTFKISTEEVESIRSQVAEHGKYEPLFIATIYGEKGEVVAEVEKKLWVKKK